MWGQNGFLTLLAFLKRYFFDCLDTCSVPRQGNSTLKGFAVTMHNIEKEPAGCVEVEMKNTENEGFLGEEPCSFFIRRQNVKALQ